jgi:hypothetical protein
MRGPREFPDWRRYGRPVINGDETRFETAHFVDYAERAGVNRRTFRFTRRVLDPERFVTEGWLVCAYGFGRHFRASSDTIAQS